MAKTNLLAQNDDLAIESLKQSVGRSVMNLSHSVTYPIDVDGGITPICCVETVPSDAFEISVECLLRQLSPLKVPIMTNFRLNTAFYYCDNRVAWKKWDRFMTGGRSGNEVYSIPVMANATYTQEGQPSKVTVLDRNPSGLDYNSTIHTYFGISMNHDFPDSIPSYSDFPDDTDNLPIAIPFFDYQLICRDYYTNVDRLPQNPQSGASFYSYTDIDSDWAYSNLFPSDEDEIKLRDGINEVSGFNTGDDPEHVSDRKGFLLDKKRYHNVREDYFVSSKKAPMRGDAPTLTSSQTLTLPAGTEITYLPSSGSRFADFDIVAHAFSTSASTIPDMHAPITGVGDSVVSSDLVYRASPTNAVPDTPFSGSTFNRWADNQKLSGSAVLPAEWTLTIKDDVLTSSTIQTTATAAEIRLLSQLTVWQELNMLHEPYYNDFLNAHFEGVHVGDSPAEKPIYIGGTSQLISINEILQTSQTSDTSPLGTQGATAMSLANNYVGKYYCNNYGYIIGVAYIIPDMYYEPAIPRGFSRRTKEDFYSPEFANLSMQATLNKEVYYSNDEEWNNSPWGYTGAFDELRSIPNRIAGDLLNDDYTDLKAWVLRREFANDNKPSMSSKFLSLKGNVDKTAFQVPSMPAFMLQCANYIKAVRPMPKVAIPKAL